MTFTQIQLTDYLDIVTPGVKPFNGIKKYIDTGALETGRILKFDEFTYGSRPSRANLEAHEGDVLFAKMKDTEKVFIVSKESASNIYSTGFCNLRIKEKNEFISEFIYYWLRTDTFQRLKNKECTGATQKALNETKLAQFKVPKPPLETQKKIVAILEKAEKLMQLREEADKLTDELLKSVFYDMFGDPAKNNKKFPVVKLKEIAKVVRNPVLPENIKDNTLYIGLEDIESETGRIIKINHVLNSYLKSNKFAFDQGYILYGKLRPYLNKVALPNFEGICSTDILPIIPITNKSNKYYLTFLLRNKYYVKIATVRSVGANLPRLSPSSLESFEIPLAPLSSQQKFAKIVETTEKLKEMQKQSNMQIGYLFDSLMQKIFNGELIC